MLRLAICERVERATEMLSHIGMLPGRRSGRRWLFSAQDWGGDLNRFHGLLFHMKTGVCICSGCGTSIIHVVTPTAYTNGSQAFESQVPCTHSLGANSANGSNQPMCGLICVSGTTEVSLLLVGSG